VKKEAKESIWKLCFKLTCTLILNPFLSLDYSLKCGQVGITGALGLTITLSNNKGCNQNEKKLLQYDTDLKMIGNH
jgi:hypothetical protein